MHTYKSQLWWGEAKKIEVKVGQSNSATEHYIICHANQKKKIKVMGGEFVP